MPAAPSDRRRSDRGEDKTQTEKQDVHGASSGLHPRPKRLKVRPMSNNPAATGTAPRMTRRKAKSICMSNQRREGPEGSPAVSALLRALRVDHGALHPVMRTRARGFSSEEKTSVARFSPRPGT